MLGPEFGKDASKTEVIVQALLAQNQQELILEVILPNVLYLFCG